MIGFQTTVHDLVITQLGGVQASSRSTKITCSKRVLLNIFLKICSFLGSQFGSDWKDGTWRFWNLRNVCGVNSTATKHSDYFVWKDTSERVTRRCGDTSRQEASEFLRIKTSLFLRKFSNKQIRSKPPEMLSLTRYWCFAFKILLDTLRASRKVVKTCHLSREILACDFLSFLECDPSERDFGQSGVESLLTDKHQVKMTANKWRVPSESRHPHTHVRSRAREHTHVRTNTRAHAHIHTQYTMGSDLPLPWHGRKSITKSNAAQDSIITWQHARKAVYTGTDGQHNRRWTHDERSCQRVLVWICILRRRMHLHVYTSALQWRHSYQFEVGRAILLPSQKQGLPFSEIKSGSGVKTSIQSDICAAAHSMENSLGGRWFYGYARTPNQQVHCRQRTQHRSSGIQCARILIGTTYKRSKTAFIVTFIALAVPPWATILEAYHAVSNRESRYPHGYLIQRDSLLILLVLMGSWWGDHLNCTQKWCYWHQWR